MKFTDAIEISGTRRRAEDGALIVDARVARTGIQLYAGYEVGRPDMAVVRVFRSADQVFSQDTLASFAHRPVTNDHPSEPVTVDNWKKVAVGQTADEVTAQDRYIRVPLMVSDGDAIKAIEGGKRELSAGYSCDLDFTAGKTLSGEAYDAQQINIRANHVAIVDSARGGPALRIGDAWGVNPIETKDAKTMATKMMIVDGLPIEVTDQSEAMINRLTRQLADSTANVAKLTTDHAAAIAAKDTEIGTLKADLKKAQDAAPTPAAIDKMVADRAELVASAKKIVADVKTEGLTDAEIRRAVVIAKFGDGAEIKDASDAEIAGMYKVLSRDAGSGSNQPTDPFRSALITRPTNDQNANDHGQSAYEKRISDAWKGAPATTAAQ